MNIHHHLENNFKFFLKKISKKFARTKISSIFAASLRERPDKRHKTAMTP